MATPIEFKSYREFIAHELAAPRFGYGARSRLADFLGVQKSFVSLVLKGEGDFSLDHGLRIAAFLELDREDRDLFLLVMNRDRAGTTALREYYADEIRRARAEREQIKHQIQEDAAISDEHYSEYSASWLHSAIQMCIRNPALREADALAAYLKLDRAAVVQSLKLLERIGLARSFKGRYQPEVARINISEDSPARRAQLVNWRLRAIDSLDQLQDQSRPRNLYYSLQVSVDAAAIEEMRKQMLQLAKKFEPLIKAAGDEEVYAINLDLFKVGG